MPYTEEEGGILNNFAREPKMYTAEEPTSSEKKNYLVYGALAVALIGGVMAVAVYASSAS
ncbi:ssl1498 family light-harvesting-like protein [Waterburya agarophytonicola K14]|uniref:Ssl1498 family light-harvesting-like protein n=1 Tax=Waterburya agarophytonicola KI4 TaxID=2874699 RepID=A0A964BN65_9CYAN|nr:ssl1498 family light-harvesting-like protein [Waterburya agarophytonicola]MCC0176523.1 ssl1498 family light-harvesting-like protein [Waterburya agarophytonicola KI4]